MSVRVAHAVVGAAVGVMWLVLPGMTPGSDTPVATKEPVAVARAAAPREPQEDETSTADLVLPLVAVAVVGAVAGYGYIRRVRRTRDRTTPGGASGPPPPSSAPALAEPDAAACASLVRADDRVRATRAALGFAEELLGTEAVTRFERGLREAEGELSAAFRMRQRYDEGIPEEETARRHALAGIVGRCEEAGRRLDEITDDFAGLRKPERALPFAEARFRALTGRTKTAQTQLADLVARYAPTATSTVIGDVEQAKDRLLFATARLNLTRQAADSGEPEQAVRQLRAAEGAIAQAAVFIEGVDRVAAELRNAERMLPAALTGAEAELAPVRRHTFREEEPHPRLLNADSVLASVRQESTAGQPYDPLGALRRIVRATVPLASGRSGVLPAAALAVARSSTAAADDFVMTHRGAVGATARTRLAEAKRLLTTGDPADAGPADELALEARRMAEQDVRLHGNPVADAPAEAPGTTGPAGTAGAVIGGLLPDDDDSHGDGSDDDGSDDDGSDGAGPDDDGPSAK
ncbi:hypothetical protein ACIBVL_36620 [Streptomyces sp. NPDC049687]|uniref:hypothetical protein n=1 Tax=Streptomyces sp. NPDC049687 TaxID=3365596 RepID=UPI00379F37D1